MRSRRKRIGLASSDVIDAWKATESASQRVSLLTRKGCSAGQCAST
jgi:hypothetical protein